MDEGMQIMTAFVAGFLCLAAVIITAVVVSNNAWENVATTCIEAGGTWKVETVPGDRGGDWRCELSPPTGA